MPKIQSSMRGLQIRAKYMVKFQLFSRITLNKFSNMPTWVHKNEILILIFSLRYPQVCLQHHLAPLGSGFAAVIFSRAFSVAPKSAPAPFGLISRNLQKKKMHHGSTPLRNKNSFFRNFGWKSGR